MITELTGLDVSNASLLDEGTAAAEAMMMCYSTHNGKRNKFFASKDTFPQTLAVMETRARAYGIELIIDDTKNFDFSKASEFAGVLI